MAAGAPFDENETRNPMAEDSFTLFSFVDEVESRVEMLRKQATALIGERASLLMIMDQLKSDCMRCDITSEDCQELVTNMNRLQARCEAVHVQVHTVRDEGQKQSLEKVNGVLDELHTHVMNSETVPLATVQRARALLNACLPEAVGPIDSRFQSLVLGCAVDDQKDVRRRLQTLVHDCDLETGSRSSQPVSHTGTLNSPPAEESNNSSVICDSSQSGVASVPEIPASKSNPQSADVGFNDGLPSENYHTAQWYSAPKDSVAKSHNLETQQQEDSVRHTSEKNSENSACQESDTGSCVPDSVNS